MASIATELQNLYYSTNDMLSTLTFHIEIPKIFYKIRLVMHKEMNIVYSIDIKLTTMIAKITF